jgi:hypothetical protein
MNSFQTMEAVKQLSKMRQAGFDTWTDENGVWGVYASDIALFVRGKSPSYKRRPAKK